MGDDDARVYVTPEGWELLFDVIKARFVRGRVLGSPKITWRRGYEHNGPAAALQTHTCFYLSLIVSKNPRGTRVTLKYIK